MKNPKHITLGELPDYFDNLIETLKRKNTGHVKRSEFENLEQAGADLKKFAETAIDAIQEIHDVIGLANVINN